MGIFHEPKRLAKLLASVKTSGYRPLTPIQVSEYIQEAIVELGSKDEVRKRLGFKDMGMINAFMKLTNGELSEDICNSFKFGTSDVEKYEIGFTSAHLMAGLELEEQNKLFSACFDNSKEIKFPTKEEFKRIKQYYNENKSNGLTIDDAISHILKIDRPPKGFTSAVFMAALDQEIFERLQEKAENDGESVKETAQKILQKRYGENVESVKVMETGIIRMIFSKEGKDEFDKNAASKKIGKNQLVNDLVKEGCS